MDIGESSDLQLLRISHGVHEITQMIDSWSKTSTPGFESVRMANELLRGSLELQESLQMLSRLQKASRRMSDKRFRPRGREEDEEESFFMAMSSKSSGSSCYKLQEPRLSVDACSTNSVYELKQVIRDRLCKQNLWALKSDNDKAYSIASLKFTGRKIHFSPQAKKIKAPNLIAKLMGLEQFPSGSKDHQKIKQAEEMKEQPEQKSFEEIIETMRFKGILKNDHSERDQAQPDLHGINLDQDVEIRPIVILKSGNLPLWDSEEINSASENISEREKTTLAELLLEEKTFDHGYMPMKSNLKYNKEPIPNLSIGVNPSQKQQEMELNMETKRILDRKNPVIQGKKFAELKEVEAIEAPISTTSVESTKSEKGELTTKSCFKTYKNIKQNKQDDYSTKSMARKSNRREKRSSEKPVSKFTETKIDDQKFKDGKLGSSGAETAAISRSNSMPISDGCLKQEKETNGFVNKDENKKDHKVVCEVMPKNNNQARRNSKLVEKLIIVSNNEVTTNPAAKSQQLFRHQLLNSKSFHDYAHGLLGVDACLPANSQEKNSEDPEVGGEQLLLDCAKELMALQSHEGRISFSQMLQPYQRKRPRFLSFSHLLEEISNGIQDMASYSENWGGTITKNSLYTILEKDLNASWDDGRNNWDGLGEADHVAAEVEKQIISWLIMEVVMDLADLV